MTRKARPPKDAEQGGGITRARLLEFIAANPDATKRDIARHFSLRNAAKIELKKLLRELADTGEVTQRSGRRMSLPGGLPEVTPVEVIELDTDGELICRPVQWEGPTAPPKIMLAPGTGTGTEGGALGIGERFLARLSRGPEGYEARIIKRLGTSVHTAVGVFRKLGRHARVEPVDRKARHEFLIGENDDGGATDGELVVVEPLAGRMMGQPRARVRERLGRLTEPRAISLIAIHTHGIPDQFPASALDEAERANPATLEGRTDLRKVPLVTIDPPDARDHDDAVWAEPDTSPGNDGGFRAIVAIADVSFYVRHGSALDREALRRGNSVYFPDRVVPMLPERLSADLCSLKQGVDRAVIACHMVFDANGRLTKHNFERALMRSAASLTYDEVQQALDGRPGERAAPLLDNVLKPLDLCYRALLRARAKRSPVDLDLPEHRIELDAAGRVKSIALRERFDAHRLIEEFMIQANVAAAEALESRQCPLVYRVHAPPSDEKLTSLSDFLETLNISLPVKQTVTTRMLNRILEAAAGNPSAELINTVVLRSMSQAVYSAGNEGHFGLALHRYAHFTSPIRRYADLIVHRALVRTFRLGPGGLAPAEVEHLEQVAEQISGHERRAMAAERDSTDRYIAAYMSDRVGGEFAGRVSGVTRFGLFIRLAETGADGLLPVRSLGREYFHHNERTHALVGESTGLTFRLGDRVRVKLAEATPLTGGLRFDLIEGGKPGSPPRQRRPQRGFREKPKAKRRR